MFSIRDISFPLKLDKVLQVLNFADFVEGQVKFLKVDETAQILYFNQFVEPHIVE